MRLQVVADQAGSKHTGDSRNRGKGGQPVWRSRRPTVEGVEMPASGELRVRERQGLGHLLCCDHATPRRRPGFDSLVDLRAMDGWLRCG